MSGLVIGPANETSSADYVERFQPPMGMSEGEFRELAGSILILVPHLRNEGVTASLMLSAPIWAGFGTLITDSNDRFGGFIEQHRANMCDYFRTIRNGNPQLKFLVMIDSDEEIPWDSPYRLAFWNEPIVSGVICSYQEQRGIYANIFVKDKYGVARMPSFDRTKRLPAKGLKECHSVGAGLMCIRGDVIDAIIASGQMPFVMSAADRQSCFDTGVLKVGEDTTFCAQARALGYRNYVDFAVHGVHLKTMPIAWPQSHIDPDLSVEDWAVDSKDYHHGG